MFVLCPSSRLHRVRRRAALAKYLLYSDLIAFDTPKIGIAATVSPNVRRNGREREYDYALYPLIVDTTYSGAVDTCRAFIRDR